MTVALGIGARSSVSPAQLDQAAAAALAVAPATVIATLDRRGPVVRELADRLGLPLVTFSAAELSDVPTPGTVRLTGAPSVAEAAALLAAGPGARLLLPKTIHAGVAVALAR
ncbi:cobalamin biosynthesis protein [Symbioplanes lichenis]|uniref:cobalamin biosynthesis protein n=1 Tax=Symbioplanes lichenis TaxID=1629072 RepID=UPI00273A147E|nr:cobalamin biosynthesis protein [Actinoplanes lichenis]